MIRLWQVGGFRQSPDFGMETHCLFIPLVGNKLLAVSFITVDTIHILVLNMDYVTSGI